MSLFLNNSSITLVAKYISNYYLNDVYSIWISFSILQFLALMKSIRESISLSHIIWNWILRDALWLPFSICLWDRKRWIDMGGQFGLYMFLSYHFNKKLIYKGMRKVQKCKVWLNYNIFSMFVRTLNEFLLLSTQWLNSFKCIHLFSNNLKIFSDL